MSETPNTPQDQPTSTTQSTNDSNTSFKWITDPKWVKACLFIFGTALLDVLFFMFGMLNDSTAVTWAIAAMGVVSFFGILLFVNFLSESSAFDKGEFRKAIAGSFIICYFAVVAVFAFHPEVNKTSSAIMETIIQHFTYLVGVIIIFYFGSSSVTDYMNASKQQNDNNNNNGNNNGA